MFLNIPTEQCASSRTSPALSSEVSNELHYSLALQGNDNFCFEENCLEHVLTSMEQELVRTWTQLFEAQEEVRPQW